MDFYLDGEWVRGYADDAEVARAQIVRCEGHVSVGRLSVDGNAPHGAFLLLCREIMRFAAGRKIRLVVDYGPDMERLVKVYTRLGGRPVGVVMEN